VASGAFTITPPGSVTDTVTLNDGGRGGTFAVSGSPVTSLSWSSSAAAQTFTYAPAYTGYFAIGGTSGLADAVSPAFYVSLPPANQLAGTTRGHVTHYRTGRTATGSSQATAFPIADSFAFYEFVFVASGTGTVLPVAQYPASVQIVNDGANTLSVYPPPGGTVNGGAANAAYSLAAGSAAVFWLASPLTWKVIS
jgi:hypothetical protein